MIYFFTSELRMIYDANWPQSVQALGRFQFSLDCSRMNSMTDFFGIRHSLPFR